ncbi:hypothetical protein V8F33_007932 [Rhypophila sp. PSN 637]
MDTMAHPIFVLPPELLCLVVQALDPITLISLSQSNRFFRGFISPQRIHFVQRLLALELLPEHGGIVPLFNARLNTLRPPPYDAKWDQNKYACSGCLKLLTHKMFDNHSIYGLALRKPPPGSEEATKLTAWEPAGDQVGWWKRRQRQQGHEQERLKEFRAQYATATRSRGEPVNGPQPPNGFLLAGSDDAKDERLAREAECVLCGRSRHRRLCLECKRTQGVFARRTRPNIGTIEAPIIVTRQVLIADSLSLCFPRSIFGVPEPPLPRIMRVNHPGCNIYLRSPVVVFCARCSTWQDMWAFGPDVMPLINVDTVNNLLWNRDPDDPDKSDYKLHMCHHCIASVKGIDRFRDSLLDVFLELAERSALKIRGRLHLGWSQYYYDFYAGALNKPRYKGARRRLFGSDEDNTPTRHNTRNDRSFSILCETAHGPTAPKRDPIYLATSKVKDAVGELLLRLNELRSFLSNEATLSEQMTVTESWQGIWLEDYEENEQALFYLYYLMALVRNDPQRLVDYALHPDRFRYPRQPLSSFQQDILAREKQDGAGRQTRNTRPPKKNMANEMAWKDMYLRARDRAQAGKRTLESLRANRA